MRKIDLSDLPRWSPWPARLLGLTPFAVTRRTIDKIDREYDKDKYAKLLEFHQGGVGRTPEDVRRFASGEPDSTSVCISLGNELFETSIIDANEYYSRLMADAMASQLAQCRTVVELGAGYGYNLWRLQSRFPKLSYVGADYSRNAVNLAGRLYPKGSNSGDITFCSFNFCEKQTYEFLKSVKPPMVIFTSHAVEQCLDSASILDALMLFRENIQTVFHFEPIYELQDKTMLALMRRRYIEMNDYNRDLFGNLQKWPNIRILHSQFNVFGINPVNATSILQWRFADES